MTRDGGAPLLSGRLSFSYAKSGAIRGTIGDAELRWLAARTELSGRLVATNVFSVSGCGSFELGQLQGRGSGGAVAPKTEAALWLAPGLSLRGTATLERTLVVGVEAGVFAPLIRPRFYFSNGDDADSETIHQVPVLGFRAQATLGVRFP